jgi:hypothetical protein
MGPICCPETSVRNCHYSLHNNPEERSSHLLRGGCLKSREVSWTLSINYHGICLVLFNQPKRNVSQVIGCLCRESKPVHVRYKLDSSPLLTSVFVHVNIRGALSKPEDCQFVQSVSNAVSHTDSISTLAYDNLCYTDGDAKGEPRHSQCFLPHRKLLLFITLYNYLIASIVSPILLLKYGGLSYCLSQNILSLQKQI